ncbi:MAG: 50S ribosomal protein L24 [Bacteriovoracaceae bacterium]
MQKLKLNDEVVVLAGKDKGKTGKLTKIDRKNNRVIVAGVNVVKKALKPTQQNPAGGIVDKESYVHISNVALMSPKTKKPTRVKIEVKKDKKIRVATACNSPLDK